MSIPSHADLFTLKVKPGPGLCKVKGCSHKTGLKKGGLCDKHHQQWFRFKNPKAGAYATLKGHALKRRIPFNITYDYFLGLTDACGYWDRDVENHGDLPTLDRVDPCKGYVFGNLRVVSHSENAIKGNRERHLPAHVQEILRRKRARLQARLEPDEDDCPF